MKFTLLGKMLGAFGLVLLLTSPITLFLTSGSGWIAGGKALLGVALIAGFFATNYQHLGQFASRKSSFFIASSALMTLLLVVVLVAVNYLTARRDKSWDFTQKKIYTLQPQTLTTLKNLKEKVKAFGFIPPSNPNYESWQTTFERYRREAPEHFDYAFKDPRKNPDLAAKYQLKEGQTTVILTRGESANESHTAINLVSEQELTNALIKLNNVGEQKVYFVSGHGEWPLASAGVSEQEAPSLSEFKKTLSQEGYAAENLTLLGKSDVPHDAAVLVIAGARSALTAKENELLKVYLDEGGRLLVFAEAQVENGMDKLLASYGVQIDRGIVADSQYASGSPYVVLSYFYGEHEITRLLKQMQLVVEFPTSRGLSIVREGTAPGVKSESIVLSSPAAWEETTLGDNPSPSNGEKTGQIPLVVASTRNTRDLAQKRFDEARLVVFGDSEILVNANWGHEANRNLVMNALAWASTQVSKITLRPPDRDISTLDVTPKLMAKLRFLSMDLLPLSLLCVGLVIWLRRREK